MSLTAWKPGAWKATAWRAGAWAGTETPPQPEIRPASGGGRPVSQRDAKARRRDDEDLLLTVLL